MNKAEIVLKRNMPLILTVTGSIGVITTTVLAVKATPKALKLIEESEVDSKLEMIKIAWKSYIPAAISGILTITCIFGSNYLNERNQVALISSYQMLENAYKNYISSSKEVYGEDAEINIKRKQLEETDFSDLIVQNGEEVFFDNPSRRDFTSTLDRVMYAENMILQEIENRGFVYLNEYYDYLGLPHKVYGYEVGWNRDSNLEINYSKITLKDGTEMWDIIPTVEPVLYPERGIV